MLIRLIALAALFGLLFGFDEGIIAGALPLITQTFTISVVGEGFVTAAVPLGAVGGAILASLYVDKLGRKKVLFFCSLLFGIGAIGSGLASSETLLAVARLLLGLAIGASAMTAPMFLAEVSPDRYRGAMVSAFQLMITIGILVSYCVGFLLEPLGAWRWMLALGAIPAVITFLGLLRAPESPRWLAANGEVDEAQKVISSIQPDLKEEEVDRIISDIKKTQASEASSGSWNDLMSDRLRPVVSFAIIAFLLQQVSGINAVIYYAPTILKYAGFDGTSTQLLATVGIGVVNVLMTVVAMMIVDKFGRRPLFILGFAGTSLSLLVVAYAMSKGTPDFAAMALIGLFAYIAFFAISLGPLPWLYMSELFPLRFRSKGMALASVANWSCNFAVVFLFPVVVSSFGAAPTFLIFSIFCAIGVIYTWFKAPETKGASLEDLEKQLTVKSA